MAPLQLYIYPITLPGLQIRGQNDTEGSSATNHESSGTISSPGLSATAAIGGIVVVAFALCFLWYDCHPIKGATANARTVRRKIGVFTDPKKGEESDLLPNRRTLDSISKPVSRQAWLATFKGDNLSAAHYVIDQDSWLVFHGLELLPILCTGG